MFNACLQADVGLLSDKLHFGEDENKFVTITVTNAGINDEDKGDPNHLRIVSTGGPFTSGSKVYVVKLEDSKTFFLGISSDNNERLVWLDKLVLNGSQIFNILNPSGEHPINGIQLNIGRISKAGILVLSISFQGSDHDERSPLTLTNAAELGEETNFLPIDFILHSDPYIPAVVDSDDVEDDIQNDPSDQVIVEVASPELPSETTDILSQNEENNNNIQENLISLIFHETSLGLGMRRRSDGVVYIHDILPNSPGLNMNIKPLDEILSIGERNLHGQNLNQDNWKELIQYIKESSRPIEVVLKRHPESDYEYHKSHSLSNTTTNNSNNNQLSPSTPSNNNNSSSNSINSPATLAIDYALVELSNRLQFKDVSYYKSNSQNIHLPSFNSKSFAKPGRYLLKCDEILQESKGTLWNSVNKKYLILTIDYILICQLTSQSSSLSTSSTNNNNNTNNSNNNNQIYQVEYVLDSKYLKIKTNGRNVHNYSESLLSEESSNSASTTSKSLSRSTTSPQTNSALGFELINTLSNTIFHLYTKNTKEWYDWLKLIFQIISENIDEQHKQEFGWKHKWLLGSMHSAVINQDETLILSLFQACEKGLLDFSEIETPDDDGYTPLHYACILRLQPIVRIFHNMSSDVTSADRKGLTPIHWSALVLDEQSLEMLVTHVFNIDLYDDKGRTPLYLACVEGRDSSGKTDEEALLRCIQILIQFNSNIHFIDEEGWSLIHFVAASWQHEALSALLEGGADVHIAHEEDGLTCLHLACLHSPLKRAVGLGSRIMGSSGDLFAPEPLDDPALVPTLRSLIDGGSYPNIHDNKGRSPLQILIEIADQFGENVFAAISFLLSRGGRPEDLKVLEDLCQRCYPNDDAAASQWYEMLTAAMDQWSTASMPDVYDYSSLTLGCFTREKNTSISPDTSGKAPCDLCQVQFTIFRRQHHCRLCNALCCDDCSKKRVFINGDTSPVRVCDGCFNRAAKSVLKNRRKESNSFSSLSSSRGPSVSFISPPMNVGSEAPPTIVQLPPPPAAALRSSPNTRDNDNRAGLFGKAKTTVSSSQFSNDKNVSDDSGTTASVMSEARERLKQRGEKLSTMADKSADLANASKEFANLAKQLNQQSNRWW